MKTKQYFKVSTEIRLDINNVTVTLSDSQFYFCEHIFTEVREDRKNISDVFKKMKGGKVDMITVSLSEHIGESDYRGREIECWRYVDNYGTAKTSKSDGYKFNFDSDDAITNFTAAEFIKTYVDSLNKQAFYLYIKTVSEN